MCNNNGILVLILFIKILIMLIIPVYIIYSNYRKREILYKKQLFFAEVIIMVIFIILKLFNNSCINNSSFSFLFNNNRTINYDSSYLSEDPSVVEKIVTNKIYKTNLNKNVYYFNHNDLPLSSKRIPCKESKLYMKQYGNNITAVSTLLSTVLDKNIDPIEIMNLAVSKRIIDCNRGVNTYELLKVVSEKYNLNIININQNELYDYIQKGNIVFAKADYNKNVKNNISCDISYINIYKIKNNNFYILNPNDKDYNYICPEQSTGYGSIIISKQNEKEWSIEDLYNTTSEYITLERK